MKRKLKVELPEIFIIDFCKRWKIKEFSLFGSVLHEGFGPKSDIDILVSFHEDAPWGLYEFVDMKDELEEVLGRRVDIVEKEGLRNPFRRREILHSREVIYAA